MHEFLPLLFDDKVFPFFILNFCVFRGSNFWIFDWEDLLDDFIGVVVREEEIVEEVIDTEESVAREEDGSVLDLEESFGLNLGEWCGKAFEDVDVEFLLEIIGFHATEFHLENELTDHAFLFGGF